MLSQTILLEVSLTESGGMLSGCNYRVLSIQALEQVVSLPPPTPCPAGSGSNLPHNKWMKAIMGPTASIYCYAAKMSQIVFAHTYVYIYIDHVCGFKKNKTKRCIAQAIFYEVRIIKDNKIRINNYVK